MGHPSKEFKVSLSGERKQGRQIGICIANYNWIASQLLVLGRKVSYPTWNDNEQVWGRLHCDSVIPDKHIYWSSNIFYYLWHLSKSCLPQPRKLDIFFLPSRKLCSSPQLPVCTFIAFVLLFSYFGLILYLKLDHGLLEGKGIMDFFCMPEC